VVIASLDGCSLRNACSIQDFLTLVAQEGDQGVYKDQSYEMIKVGTLESMRKKKHCVSSEHHNLLIKVKLTLRSSVAVFCVILCIDKITVKLKET